MIKKFNWLLIAAITIMMSSCTADDMKNSYNQGMVDFTVKTAIPHGITTYASHNGGATNVSSTYYNLRYILEAWTKESPPRLAYRGYRIVQNNFTGTSVDFTARLLALEYDFVFWADFVDASVTAPVSGAGAGDLYYKTNDGYTDAQLIADPTLDKGLTDILLRQDALAPAYNVSDEARDAFYAVKSVDLRTTSQIGAVTLYRPFGKFRLVSLDVVDGYLSTTPILKSKIEYTGTTDFPAGFNAQTGAVNTSVTIDLSAPLMSGIETENPAVVGGVNYPNASILALDYIFAAPTQTAAFKVSVYSDAAATNKVAEKSISNIPIVANKLTTIIGSFFTNLGSYTIVVSDPFDDDYVSDVEYAAAIGTTKYKTIQEAITASVSGDVIEVTTGVFNINAITIPAGVTLKGSGKNATVLTIDAPALISNGAVNLLKGASLEDVWVRYNTNREQGDAWASGENISGVYLGNYGGANFNTSLKNSRVSGFRNGVYANNITGITVEGNEILDNRYGIQLANGASGAITNNTFVNNEVVGLFLVQAEALLTVAPTVTGNTFDENWISDVEIRWTNTYVVNFDNNTFSNGTKTVKVGSNVSIATSSETFRKNTYGLQANIVTSVLSNVNLTGYLLYNSVSISSTYYASLSAAITAATAGQTIDISAGTFNVGTGVDIAKNLTITGTGNGSKIDGVSPAERFPTGQGRNPVIYITAGNVTLENLTISAEKTPVMYSLLDGITATGGNLTLTNVTIDGIFDANGPNAMQTGNGITLHNSVQLTATNSTFKRFNKNGIILHNTSSATINNCSFIGNNDITGANATQNGIIFRKDGTNNATGSVSNSSFKDFVYDGDSSIGVWVYTPNAVEPSVVDGGGNTYTNNDRDWYVGDN